MNPLSDFKKNPILAKVINITKTKKLRVYLVGGFLRDAFLNRVSFDLDFAVDKNAIKFAKSVSHKLNGNLVILDKQHGSSRVIIKHKGNNFNLDFTDFRGLQIKEDLFRRDFSINALAFDTLLLKKAKRISDILIDPYFGMRDIYTRSVRAINDKTFRDDPLRILRAFSMSATLKFNIDSQTLTLARKEKRRISSVSAERIREELFKILKVADAAKFFKMMDESSVLDKVMPEINIMRGIQQGPYHHLDVLEHSFETMHQLEKLFWELRRKKKIVFYLDEIIAGNHSRGQILKLAAFLHDIGKPGSLTHDAGKTKFHGHERLGKRFASKICDRLKLSMKEKEAINTIIFWHLRPGYLADNPNITDRAKFRYFRDTHNEGLSILLLSIADQRATRGPLTHDESRVQHEKTCLCLSKEYFKRKEEKKLPKLITGDDLIRKLKLNPGPLFREILEKVEEEQAAGEIRSKKSALELARKIVNIKS